MNEQTKKELAEYISANVRNLEKRYDLALDTIGIYRCNLQYADPSLYDEICNVALEYGEDNYISEEEIYDYIDENYYM